MTDNVLDYARPRRRRRWWVVAVLLSMVAAGVAGCLMRSELREVAAPVERWYDEWQQSRRSAAAGRADAEQDWKLGVPRLMSDADGEKTDLPHGEFLLSYDPATGLRLRPTVETDGCLVTVFDESYELAYNARIHELIEQHGLPPTDWPRWEGVARRLPELAESAEWQAAEDVVRGQWIAYGNSQVFVADIAEDSALQLVKVSTPYYDDVAYVDYYLTERATDDVIARVSYRAAGAD